MPVTVDVMGIIWLSTVSAAISFTVADALIFKLVREWIAKKSDFFGHLVCCGYCTSYWIAFALELIFQPNLFDIKIIGHLLTSFIIAWLSGLQWIVMVILTKKGDK